MHALEYCTTNQYKHLNQNKKYTGLKVHGEKNRVGG